MSSRKGCITNLFEIEYYGALHLWVTVYSVTILCRSAATKISAALQRLLLMLKGAAHRNLCNNSVPYLFKPQRSEILLPDSACGHSSIKRDFCTTPQEGRIFPVS